MICNKFDGYMTELCHQQLMISWMVTLTNGETVYGDYDRPNHDNPWIRLKEYCKQNNVLPSKVELYMFGAEHKIFFEDPSGLDGIVIFRGVAKDQAMDGSDSQSYQFLTVGLLKDDCSAIDISKYTWPFNKFEEKESVRGLSLLNLEHMIFKNESEKRKHPEVQKYLDGATV